jgi:hypothetical protein
MELPASVTPSLFESSVTAPSILFFAQSMPPILMGVRPPVAEIAHLTVSLAQNSNSLYASFSVTAPAIFEPFTDRPAPGSTLTAPVCVALRRQSALGAATLMTALFGPEIVCVQTAAFALTGAIAAMASSAAGRLV